MTGPPDGIAMLSAWPRTNPSQQQLIDVRSRRVRVATPEILTHQRNANLMQFQCST
jgi:hypothetical protein